MMYSKYFKNIFKEKIEKNICFKAWVQATSISMNRPLILTFQHISLVLLSCVNVYLQD
jgi:hypothetical protein